jgi:single-strand DNA-binding protein
MANLNKVLLIGNLTRDPELRHTPKGTAVAELGLAINRTWKDDSGNKQEETTFVDITFWGRQAEVIQQYCAKGDPLYVEGRLQLDTWDDKETGKKRSKLRIIGEQFQFLASKNSGDRNNNSGMSREESSARAKAPAASGSSTAAPADDFQEDDDIPF